MRMRWAIDHHPENVAALIADMCGTPQYGLRSLVSDAEDYICGGCGRTFQSWSALKGHWRWERGAIHRRLSHNPLPMMSPYLSARRLRAS